MKEKPTQSMKSNGLLSCQFVKMQYNRTISVIFCGLGLGGLWRARAFMIIPAFAMLKMNSDVHGFGLHSSRPAKGCWVHSPRPGKDCWG